MPWRAVKFVSLCSCLMLGACGPPDPPLEDDASIEDVFAKDVTATPTPVEPRKPVPASQIGED